VFFYIIIHTEQKQQQQQQQKTHPTECYIETNAGRDERWAKGKKCKIKLNFIKWIIINHTHFAFLFAQCYASDAARKKVWVFLLVAHIISKERIKHQQQQRLKVMKLNSTSNLLSTLRFRFESRSFFTHFHFGRRIMMMVMIDFSNGVGKFSA
jgi:hypothetical protein